MRLLSRSVVHFVLFAFLLERCVECSLLSSFTNLFSGGDTKDLRANMERLAQELEGERAKRNAEIRRELERKATPYLVDAGLISYDAMAGGETPHSSSPDWEKTLSPIGESLSYYSAMDMAMAAFSTVSLVLAVIYMTWRFPPFWCKR